MELYVYAIDEDNALELLGNGAADEFESLSQAEEGYDTEQHTSRDLYKVSIELVRKRREEP